MTTIKLMEVTEEELNRIIADREREAKEKKVKELAKQLEDTLAELKKLHVCVLSQNDSRYASVTGDPIYKVTCDGRSVKLHC